MTRSLKIYQGEDETPVFDVTEPSSNVHVVWEEVEAGGRAFRGESNLGTFPMRDERGETGSELNLPSGLSHISLSAGSRIEWLVTDSSAQQHRLFRGRIGPKDYTRGRQKADRAREVTVSANDTNYDLRNIIVDGWSRPEESDTTRVLALITDYLSGSPRASTTIASTYVATGSNTVTLGPKVYDATSPADVLSEIATIADKLHFVTIDDELFYDGYDSTAYQAGVRISDRIDELNTSATCAEGSVSLVDAWIGDAGTGSAGSGLSPVAIEEGLNNAVLFIVAGPNAFDTWPPPVPEWRPDGESVQTATLIDSIADGLALYYIANPTPGEGSFGTYDNPRWVGGWLYENVNQTSPIAESDFAEGTGATATGYSVATTGSGQYFSAVSIFTGDFTDDSVGVPEPGAGMTLDWGNSNELGTPGFVDMALAGGHGDASPTWTFDQSQDWAAMVARIRSAGAGSGAATFPPIWDVGPSSTEDGMELLSGLRLYYGQGSNTYVYVSDPTTANQYWHSEQSIYTNDPLINTPTKATTLAEAILTHRKRERRTYNVSIGPLNEDQVGCLKPGHLIQIKARAIPDADDQFVTRRIAQLRWTTPVPGTYFAHMMLDQPMKDAPSGIGPKQATDSINRHVEQGSNSHPEYVQRGILTTQGDLPYRGASDWTRLALGSSNTHLVSDGITPKWVANTAGSSGPDLTAINFLVGTASGDLSNEIVVGTSPGGELGGTWASPTVDSVHSGSSHATQASDLTTRWIPLTVYDPGTGNYLPLVDGDGNQLMAEAS